MNLKDNTSLQQLMDAGATSLGDIPLVELLEYVRGACIQVAADDDDEEMGWGADFTNAAMCTDEAIEALDRAIPRQ